MIGSFKLFKETFRSRRFPDDAKKLLKKSRNNLAAGDVLSAMKNARSAAALDPRNKDARRKNKEVSELYFDAFRHANALTKDFPERDRRHSRAVIDRFKKIALMKDGFAESIPSRSITPSDVSTTGLSAPCFMDHALIGPERTLWFYWDSGIADAPDLVQKSLMSWQTMNPDHRVIVLDRSNLADYIGIDLAEVLNVLSVALLVAGQSDLIRLLLLYRYGGTWVDATTFCMKSLNHWLPVAKKHIGFFCFRHTEETDRTLVSWFLHSSPRHPIIERLLEEAIDYLSKERPDVLIVISPREMQKFLRKIEPSKTSMDDTGYNLIELCERFGFYPYFWMFYIFEEIVKEEKIKPNWEKLLLKENSFSLPNHSFDRYRTTNVAKLTYKRGFMESAEGKDRLDYFLAQGMSNTR